MTKYLLALFLLAPALPAQPPRNFFPWWDSPLARDLKLTEDQHRQIQTAVRENRGKMIDLRAALEKAEVEVEDVFNEDHPDNRRAQEAIDRLVAARGELTRAFAQMSLRLRGVLTTEQWRELQRRRPRGMPALERGERPLRPGRRGRAGEGSPPEGQPQPRPPDF